MSLRITHLLLAASFLLLCNNLSFAALKMGQLEADIQKALTENRLDDAQKKITQLRTKDVGLASGYQIKLDQKQIQKRQDSLDEGAKLLMRSRKRVGALTDKLEIAEKDKKNLIDAREKMFEQQDVLLKIIEKYKNDIEDILKKLDSVNKENEKLRNEIKDLKK